MKEILYTKDMEILHTVQSQKILGTKYADIHSIATKSISDKVFSTQTSGVDRYGRRFHASSIYFRCLNYIK